MDAGADSFGPALYMDGICQPAVDVPADADPRTRVLARLGRPADPATGTGGGRMTG